LLRRLQITFLFEDLAFSASSNDPFAKLKLHLMGAFAEFERSIINKRQACNPAPYDCQGDIVLSFRGAAYLAG